MERKEYWRWRHKEEFQPAYQVLMKFYPLTIDDLDDEEWLPIPDYDGYQISNFGRVKSFWHDRTKILNPAVSMTGYLHVGLYKDGKQKTFRVHRLVAEAFIPNPEGKPQINHRDGHKLNCHVSNLEWVTRSENVRHAFDIGLSPQGEDRPEAKLTNEQVRYVRDNPDKLLQKKLADLFGVDKATISYIQTGKTFKQASGVVRKARKKSPRVPDDIRNQIRAEYQRGVKGCGSSVLAKKYGYGATTIRRIANEN